MKNKVIIATKNSGKANEFKEIIANDHTEVLTLLDLPEDIDIEEAGSTFEENAILKAETIAKKYETIVIADDSGLVIDALDGRPGVYSARYAGEEKNDDANIDKVLAEMAHVPRGKRSARFYCALAAAIPGKETIVVSGTCEGEILPKRMGNHGFGYDPIFYVNELGQSMAELSSEQKNQISHRANALEKLEAKLATLIQKGEEK